MSPRMVIAAQTGIVVGLVGLALYQSRLLRDTQQELDAALAIPEFPPITNQRPIRLRLQELPPINVRTQVRELDWRTIESNDYAEYVANLRKIGCPEDTIRDIILADVNQLYEARRWELEPPPGDWEFWRHPDEIPPDEAAAEEARAHAARLTDLERERRQLLAGLLGESGLRAEFEQLKAEQLRDRSIQFLAPEKRIQIADVLARWRHALDLGALADESQRASRYTEAERILDQELSALLTPREREEYEMRASPLAQRLRERLRGFGASREEFEQMFRLERRLGEELASIAAAAGEDPQAAERLQAASLELDQQIRQSLEPQRYAEYQRSLDPDYQTLYSLALDHEVPTSVANQVWDMRRAVQQQTERIRENPLLTADQKALALAAIRSETEAAIVTVLGEPLLEAYQLRGGEWLNHLTDPADLAPAAPVAAEPGLQPQNPNLQQVLAAPIP
jgi:hypothetical protein